MKYDDLKNSLGVGKVGYSAPFFRFGFVKYARYLERGFFQGIFDIFRDLLKGCGLIGERAMSLGDSYARSLSLEAQNDRERVSLEAQNDSCWENFLRFKRGMLTLALALVVSLGIANESWAVCSTGCKTCDTDNTTCLDCASSYYLKDGNCISCYNYGVWGSTKCQYNDETGRVEAITCESGFTLVDGQCVSNAPCLGQKLLVDGKCSAEAFKGCAQYYYYNSKCAYCYSGFKKVDGVCVEDEEYVIPETNKPHCLYEYGNYCKYCSSGYVSVNGSCVAINELPECTSGSIYGTCRSGNTWGCRKGYYKRVASYEKCQECSTATECEDYTAASLACKSGYYMAYNPASGEYVCSKNCNYNDYLNTTTGRCEKKPDGCKNVNSDGTCADEKCWKGYAKNASGNCEKVDCPENCDYCNINLQCTECATGYLTKGAGCVSPEACTGEYIIDEANGACKKIPGCLNFANGACGGCESGYYKKEGGCVSAEEGCGSSWLEKNRECIEASKGCGAGYKNMGGWCNRVQYTPVEAAGLLNNDNTNFVTITFRK